MYPLGSTHFHFSYPFPRLRHTITNKADYYGECSQKPLKVVHIAHVGSEAWLTDIAGADVKGMAEEGSACNMGVPLWALFSKLYTSCTLLHTL